MASIFATKYSIISLVYIFLASFMFSSSLAARMLEESSTQPMTFQYHNGPLLSGPVSVNLIWYGNFKPPQKAIISDFVTSLSSSKSEIQPSVAMWWNSIRTSYSFAKPNSLALSIGKQVVDETYSLGKLLTIKQLEALASKGPQQANSINVVFTAADVAVDGFCVNRCGTHGSTNIAKSSQKFTYIWVGNSETQCPGQCAWPFHQPIYGPQSAPLMAPNNDIGMDGMVINLASLLAGTVTNPYGSGYFQGPKDAPLEAASACPGIYGKGAYPGYAGNLLIDTTTGASYNANGINNRKYLLPALYDPKTASCSTLV